MRSVLLFVLTGNARLECMVDPPMRKDASPVVPVNRHFSPSSCAKVLIRYDLPVPAVPSISIRSGGWCGILVFVHNVH